MLKKKLDADKKLIKAFLGEDPIDWARYENGSLVYLNKAGQKFLLTNAEIIHPASRNAAELSTADKERKAGKSKDSAQPSEITAGQTGAAH